MTSKTTLRWSQLHFVQVLRRRKQEERGFAGLARAITRRFQAAYPATDLQGRDVIDRRKLRNLLYDPERDADEGGPGNEKDEGVALSIDELRAIDVYLEDYGESLAQRPLFQQESLLQNLAASGGVTFLLGSKGEEERSINGFDLLGTAELQRHLTELRAPVRLDIQDVTASPEPNAEGTEPWMELFEGPGPSLVVLGSNRSNRAANHMLELMFEARRLPSERLEARKHLPFHYVWNSRLQAGIPSLFRLDPLDVRHIDPEASEAATSGDASLLALEKEVLADTVTLSGWGEAYGVCVAQQRSNGAVWLLLGGVSGAATLAAARRVRRMSIGFSRSSRSQHSRVYWAVVKGYVPEEKKRESKSGIDLQEETYLEPRSWQPPR